MPTHQSRAAGPSSSPFSGLPMDLHAQIRAWVPDAIKELDTSPVMSANQILC